MTPARRAKIKALAEDERGNPATRAIAKRLLERYPEPPKPPRQQRVPGVERSPEYLQFMFMDLNRWKRTPKGNLIHFTSYKGTAYRFLLFKSRDGWGWARTNLADDKVGFSQVKYATHVEAHGDAWKSLQTIV